MIGNAGAALGSVAVHDGAQALRQCAALGRRKRAGARFTFGRSDQARYDPFQ